ncbi:hypothetical protein HOK68_05000 [Candidatus Woesearchaeota archaeon]|mgnify:CR=1 FL=1|jgi:hypothetical protein|nr:hypothetical protein [Candidatus Woesearchaeota archaeon]MBT4387326.1 hypothetical protein [Candidatus Woesearchaeota archaeon]MBT4595465.1 hypothetical protein [Candidatus Woesearchaeota archaeon]MBT6506106.1 hypothetical protein [Candidatus Woesearchaeota archaeon]MBT7849731.1 hypothetical protein [Candidatus Woesearchaeota archaeon]
MRDRVLDFVKANGPVIPTAVSKNLKIDSILAGAFLSSLISLKLMKVSDLKVGSSPLYYTEGQEKKLQDFSSNLNEKDFKTYLTLKENQVLRDSQCDALTRVSLSTLRDFAIPLNITYNGEAIKIWKWYLLKDNQLTQKITELLNIDTDSQKTNQNSDESKQEINNEPKVENKTQLSDQKAPDFKILKTQLEKTEQNNNKRIEELERLVKTIINKTTNSNLPESNVISETNDETDAKFVDQTESLPKNFKHLNSLLNQKNIKLNTDDDIYIKVNDFISKNNCQILNFKILRKSNEADFLINQNNFFGSQKYYLKFKNKKIISDSDLQITLEGGNLINLTPILISTSDLNKKGISYLNNNDGKIFFSKL